MNLNTTRQSALQNNFSSPIRLPRTAALRNTAGSHRFWHNTGSTVPPATRRPYVNTGLPNVRNNIVGNDAGGAGGGIGAIQKPP